MEFRPPLFPRTTIIKQQPSGHTASSDLLYLCLPFLRTRERRANRTAPIPGRLGLDADASYPTESQDVSIPVSGLMTLQTLRVKLVSADFFIVSGYGITTRSPRAHMICPVQRVSSSPLLQPLQYSRYTRYMIATHVFHMLVIGQAGDFSPISPWRVTHRNEEMMIRPRSCHLAWRCTPNDLKYFSVNR
jgi:hypothetical protein